MSGDAPTRREGVHGAVDCYGGKTPHDIFEIVIGMNLEPLAGLDQQEDDRCCLAAALTAEKEPVLAAKR